MRFTSDTRRLRGVIFDLDGVLVQSEPFIVEAAIRMFAEKGHAVSPTEFRPFVGMGEDRFIGGVAEARGIPLVPESDKARTYAIYLDLIRGRLQPLPGAVAFVGTCKDRGFALAVASGADAIKVEANLREAGFDVAMFDAVVTGNDVVRKKPAPDIFIEASRRLAVDPSSCLVVEDALVGVTAAKAAGARCLGLSSSFGAAELASADWVAVDFTAVPAEVLAW
jgi:HAD superfamily hydrolase (TIGR01509 family)